MVLGLNVRQEEVSWQVDLLRERRHELQMDFVALFEERTHVRTELRPIGRPLVQTRRVIIVADVECLLLVGLAGVTGRSLGGESAMERFDFSCLDLRLFKLRLSEEFPGVVE